MKKKLPKPIRSQGRICFAIDWYKTEEEAQIAAAEVVRRGDTYNGGFYHGAPCGRDSTWDYVDPKLGKLYAVTTN